MLRYNNDTENRILLTAKNHIIGTNFRFENREIFNENDNYEVFRMLVWEDVNGHTRFVSSNFIWFV